ALTARRLDPGLAAGPRMGVGPGMVPVPAAPAAASEATPDGAVEMVIDPLGVAVLRGVVPTLADRVAIGQKLAQTPGVAQVINLLTIRGQEPAAGAGARPGGPPPPPQPAVPGAPAVAPGRGAA